MDHHRSDKPPNALERYLELVLTIAGEVPHPTALRLIILHLQAMAKTAGHKVSVIPVGHLGGQG